VRWRRFATSRSTGKIVVDTSVLIKWIKTTDEELAAEARRLLAEIESRPMEVHVPALLLYEVGNILLTKTRLKARALRAALDALEALPFKVAPPASPLLRRAIGLGRKYKMTLYDASFVALAVALDCVFVTADRRLYERVQTLDRARFLTDVSSLT
jgi:predicted nucleic acid-binding protein